MHRTITAFTILCAILAATAHACLWDRDTLAAEAKGLPGITEIITGRFDRFPPLYYEMRLERVSGRLATEQDNLELYDDAGVACDRLGRSDEGIGWMERKLAVMDRLEAGGGDVGEHRYRYLANLGTFYIHRWLKSGADRGDMADVERSLELIAAAIELNPDAHFGRERYQLLAIDWILLDDQLREETPSFLNLIPGLQTGLSNFPNNKLAQLGFDDAVEGLAGLIQLGSAWESVDIFTALTLALDNQGDAVLGLLCHLRGHELVADGKSSLLKEGMYPAIADCTRHNIANRYDPGELQAGYYTDAREEADAWVNSRNQYILDRLDQGQHPDTHSGFWGEWKETSSPPKLPDRSIWPTVLILAGTLVVFLLVVVTFVFLVRMIVQLARGVLSA